jgi:hypothetical protein
MYAAAVKDLKSIEEYLKNWYQLWEFLPPFNTAKMNFTKTKP